MPVGINFSIEDAKGARSRMTVNLPDATTDAAVATYASALALLIDELTTGVIRNITAVRDIAQPAGLDLEPDPLSDVEEGARFIWNTTGGFHTSMRIPTFDEQFIVPASRLVIVDDPDVEAFIQAIQTGLSGTAPVDYRGADIGVLRSALEAFQRSRAGRG